MANALLLVAPRTTSLLGVSRPKYSVVSSLLIATLVLLITTLVVLLVKVALVLLDGISLDSLAVVGILGSRLNLTVDEGTSESSHQLFGLIVGSRLTYRCIG